MPGKPYIDLYVGDWKKDPNVQTLTLEEKGAWIEILMLMHESEYRGKLLIRGEPMTFDVLAGLLRIDKQKAEQIVGRLLATGVAEYGGEPAVLYCRRMVREEKLHRNKVDAGRSGGLAKALAESKQKPSRQGSKSLAALDIDSDNDIEAVTREEEKDSEYPPSFETAWQLYPSRGDASNPKKSAFKAWEARRKEGASVDDLLKATKAYAAFCFVTNKEGTEFAMQAQTFFGSNERWKEYLEKGAKEQERIVEHTQPLREVSEEERVEQIKEIDKITGDLADRMKVKEERKETGS